LKVPASAYARPTSVCLVDVNLTPICAQLCHARENLQVHHFPIVSVSSHNVSKSIDSSRGAITRNVRVT